MGLLYKAVSQYALTLDDPGKKLRDRILRIAEKGTAPYTALSLLKAYGSFQCGICLRLIERAYVSYASVGLGIEKTVISPEQFPPGLSGPAPLEYPPQRYYKIGSPGLLSITAMEPHAVIWAFPLDDEQPRRYILLLAEEVPPPQAARPGEFPFNPPKIARILGDISGVLRSPPQTGLTAPAGKTPQRAAPKPRGANEANQASEQTEEKTLTPQTPDQKGPAAPVLDVPGEIRRFYSRKPLQSTVQGILFALSGDAAPVLPVLAPLGSIIPVAAGYLLVLFQKPVDRELLAHRLSHSLGLSTVVRFEADTPERLLALLRPYSPYGS
ncbi:MAG: hypothetical protein LBP88_09105 [Treponema sp.]|jgi:hypothetical protein|nr:hypothetical protein [Treponema sp.]